MDSRSSIARGMSERNAHWARTAFLLLPVVLFVSSLAGSSAFIAISRCAGYAQALKDFQAAAGKFARVEVRLTPSDSLYHRPFHRRDEGPMSTLPEAMRLGFERCGICSPPTMTPAPRRPLAWIGGIVVFVLASLCLSLLLGRRLGLNIAVGKPFAMDAAPLSHLNELSHEFDRLQAGSGDLLDGLTGLEPSGMRTSQSRALSVAILRWAARWTHREISAGSDMEAIEDVAAPADLSGRPRWLQQQFEYCQLLWKAADRSTARIQIDAGKRLLDQLARDARLPGVEPSPPDVAILNELSELMAHTVAFFRENYAADSRLPRYQRTPKAAGSPK